MMEPIKAGDQCKVIDGALKGKSPNVGKTVTVVSIQGDHSRLGRIWRCTGESLEQFDGSIDTWADFPAVWLKKMPKANWRAKEYAHEDAQSQHTANSKDYQGKNTRSQGRHHRAHTWQQVAENPKGSVQ